MTDFKSRVSIEDYQLDPVVRAIQMPRVNLLIADDVGLGKTIEAGLVIQELFLRQRSHTVLVVCPAGLQIQWRDQMREKFGLDFRIVDSSLMKDLRRTRGLHVNPWTHFPRLITSIDFLKRERPLRLFREVLPPPGKPAFPRRFDLIIVDEAHNIAPSGSGKYATDSLRTAAIRTLAPHFEHRLFLTATPHNGYTESFAALLELLDDQRFHRGMQPTREQLASVMIRRLKSEIMRAPNIPRFPRRTLVPLEVDYSAEERVAHRLLNRYAELRRSAPRDHTEKFATDFVLKLLKKRLFSSPEAFKLTLERHEQTLRSARRRESRRSRKFRVEERILRRQVESAEEDYADDELYEEKNQEVIDSASRLFRTLGEEERNILRDLKSFAERSAAGPDSKANALLRWLEAELRPGGSWSEERVIIFTEYRATQNWLHQILAERRLAGKGRVLSLYGGMQDDERERIKAAFLATPDEAPVRILLATDAASEGIDLQRHCSRLIHYEIPWNPTRMEQRNGRVDRHGQKANEVLIYHFVGKGYDAHAIDPQAPPGSLDADLEFLARASRKLEAMHRDLFGKVSPVIASQVEEAMLGARSRLDTEAAELAAEPVRRLLSFERKLNEQLEALGQQLRMSRHELRLSPENIARVVRVGLELAGQPPLRPIDFPEIWPDPEGLRARSPVFRLPALRGSWARCAEGLAHPHTGKIRPIVFEHELAEKSDKLVLAHLNHRLVQMCLNLLRAEIWSSRKASGSAEQPTRTGLSRVAAFRIPDHVSSKPLVLVHARLVVLGGDNVKLLEEIIVAGGRLEGSRFERLGVGEISTARAATRAYTIAPELEASFVQDWEIHRERLTTALEARMRERTKTLDSRLDTWERREIENLKAVLEELRRSIDDELGREVDPQLTFGWTDTEKEQLQQNRDMLRRRRDEIPGEIERETLAIQERFSKPTPRLFPVAVTYLVPERLARALETT